jgi:tRNA(fMet)-specific endonuclease VapC
VNYFLDTNAVIALLKNRPSGVRSRLRRALSRGAVIAVSSVVLYELWYGVARSERRRENAERLRIFLSGNITIVLFDEKDAVAAGDLRATLETAGTPIAPYDLLIAAQALRTGATLVMRTSRNSLVCAASSARIGPLKLERVRMAWIPITSLVTPRDPLLESYSPGSFKVAISAHRLRRRRCTAFHSAMLATLKPR